MQHTKMPFPQGLVVSCQALRDEPLHSSEIMSRMAVAAAQGGAVAIRSNSPEDIKAIKGAVTLPVIGIYKVDYENSPIYITPTLGEVEAVVGAGSDVVSLDATSRPRPGESLRVLVDFIHDADRLAMADVSTVEEGKAAEQLGFDIVASTMSGYTSYTEKRPRPDLDLVRDLTRTLRVPVLAEGHIWTPEQVRSCFERGAYAVVVGSAITRPQLITEYFASGYRDYAAERGMA